MDKHQMRPVHTDQSTMWTLSADRKFVRLAVPPLRLVGFPSPWPSTWTSARKTWTR
jgi:hypothetical protein